MRLGRLRKNSNGQEAGDRQSVDRPSTADDAAVHDPGGGAESAAGTPGNDADGTDVQTRFERLERQNQRMRLFLLVLVLVVGYMAFAQLPDGIIVRQTLMESKELKLVDGSGNARMFLRMYSRVPVLQLLDSRGKPRLSMGMRFDDTPFIDMSDSSGQTRATFEMTEEDEPTIRLYDEKGQTSFTIN